MKLRLPIPAKIGLGIMALWAIGGYKVSHAEPAPRTLSFSTFMAKYHGETKDQLTRQIGAPARTYWENGVEYLIFPNFRDGDHGELTIGVYNGRAEWLAAPAELLSGHARQDAIAHHASGWNRISAASVAPLPGTAELGRSGNDDAHFIQIAVKTGVDPRALVYMAYAQAAKEVAATR